MKTTEDVFGSYKGICYRIAKPDEENPYWQYSIFLRENQIPEERKHELRDIESTLYQNMEFADQISVVSSVPLAGANGEVVTSQIEVGCKVLPTIGDPVELSVFDVEEKVKITIDDYRLMILPKWVKRWMSRIAKGEPPQPAF